MLVSIRAMKKMLKYLNGKISRIQNTLKLWLPDSLWTVGHGTAEKLNAVNIKTLWKSHWKTKEDKRKETKLYLLQWPNAATISFWLLSAQFTAQSRQLLSHSVPYYFQEIGSAKQQDGRDSCYTNAGDTSNCSTLFRQLCEVGTREEEITVWNAIKLHEDWGWNTNDHFNCLEFLCTWNETTAIPFPFIKSGRTIVIIQPPVLA